MTKYEEIVLKLRFDILDEYKEKLLIYKNDDYNVKYYLGKINQIEKEILKSEI